MHTLLLSATPFEIAPLREKWEEEDRGLKLEYLVGGVGILATAYALTRKTAISKPDLVIQAGIGGGTADGEIGKTFVIARDHIADLGVSENNQFRTIFQLGLAEENSFPFSAGSLVNPYRELLSLPGLELKDGITVNEISTGANRIGYLQKKYPGAIESMEGAALHYVCLQEKIPFLQLRAVSNLIGERDKKKWQLRESMAALNGCLLEILEKLNGEYEIEPGF